MSDFIKRSDAVEYVMSILDVNKYYHPHSKSRNVPIDEVVDRINQVPAADLSGQLPKLGEWQKAKPKGVVTYSDGYAECSHCHETIWLGWGMNFCPHCGTQNKIIDPDDYDGAKMEVQE